MIIDIHSHIIPYVDDGADDWDIAIGLVKSAASQGVVAMVATPHILAENDYTIVEEKIIKNYVELKSRLKENNINVKIYLACEIYVQPDMSLDHQISTFNNNKTYFLAEMPMTEIPRFVAEKFFNFIMDGKIPIIAHPERNLGFQNRYDLAYEFVQRGALMQINASSLLGKYGNKARETAFSFISHNLAHFVASDGHNTERRTIRLKESYDLIASNYGELKARTLFFENPKIAVQGQKNIINEDPVPFDKKEKKSFWNKLKF